MSKLCTMLRMPQLRPNPALLHPSPNEKNDSTMRRSIRPFCTESQSREEYALGDVDQVELVSLSWSR